MDEFPRGFPAPLVGTVLYFVFGFYFFFFVSLVCYTVAGRL